MDIKIKELTHLYHEGSPFERSALKNINLFIPTGTFLSVIGHTGSGKSTLVQHINGLLKPSKGQVTVGDVTIKAKEKAAALKALRKRVGLVFQYPEHQLFEETVEKDIMFGPLNFGVGAAQAKQLAKAAIKRVGLSEAYLERSPFDLSGGQMRRVAIAGVLALEPEILILDEPTAGLDPRGRQEMLKLFYDLHCEKKMTTIMVTHNMEDAAFYSDEVLVMDHGEIVMKDKPENVFSHGDRLEALGLDIPVTMQFLQKLVTSKAPSPVFSIDDTALEVMALLADRGERPDV